MSLTIIRRTAALLLLLASTCLRLAAQDAADPSGKWTGAIQVPGQQLDVVVYLARGDADVWKGTVDIPLQGAKGLALSNVSVAGLDIACTIDGVPGNPTFKGTLSADGMTISGSFMQGGGRFPFTLAKESLAEREAEIASAAAALDDIRAFIAEAMKTWDVPGLSVAIVRGDSVIFSEGFGYRDLERKLPVDPETMFAIGSSTKAFTSFVVASLVDEEKLAWDTPIATYLPSFHLQDECASKMMTPRDLLLHVSGLPRHDLLWYGSSLTRQELFERLRYLEPSTSFRGRWQYQNLMYMTAGYLAANVAGTTWEDLVQTKIFDPLGMKRSNFSVSSMERDSNTALPYQEKNKAMVRIPYRSLDQIGPAGSINSTAEDMARWVRLHLGNGSFHGARVISQGTLAQLHAPQVVVPGAMFAAKEILFNLYGMGWFIQAYRGHRLLHHGGNIDGFTALVSMMPDDSVGLVILTNQNGSAFPTAAMFTIYDRLLGFEKVDWNARLKGMVAGAEDTAETTEDARTKDADRVPGTVPSHPVQAYAGEYEHAAYGTVGVAVDRDRLRITYNDVSAPLEHFHYDVFYAPGLPAPFSGMKVQFRSNIRGGIDELRILLEPSVSEISFAKRLPTFMSDPAVLREYAGEYTVKGIKAVVEVEGNTLLLTVPGQPQYRLVPTGEAEFSLKEVKGYVLRFEREKGKVVRVLLIQPNGTFIATKK